MAKSGAFPGQRMRQDRYKILKPKPVFHKAIIWVCA